MNKTLLVASMFCALNTQAMDSTKISTVETPKEFGPIALGACAPHTAILHPKYSYWLPIHEAASQNNIAALKQLIEAGADIRKEAKKEYKYYRSPYADLPPSYSGSAPFEGEYVTDYKYLTALTIAQDMGHREIVEYLKNILMKNKL